MLALVEYLKCSKCLPSTATHCVNIFGTLARTVSQDYHTSSLLSKLGDFAPPKYISVTS